MNIDMPFSFKSLRAAVICLIAILAGCGDTTPPQQTAASAAQAVGQSIPEIVTASNNNGTYTLGNGTIAASWSVVDGVLHPLTLVDGYAKTEVDLPTQPFYLILSGNDKAPLNASDLKIVSGPTIQPVPADPTARILAERSAGQQISIDYTDVSENYKINWTAICRDNTNYIRQVVTIQAIDAPAPITRIVLIDWPLQSPVVSGTVQGDPIISNDLFCGLEHPQSDSRVKDGTGTCSLDKAVPLSPGQTITVSSVIGVTRPGQLRRDFQRYVELERARPYAPFLHYNSWYDLGYFTPYTADQAVAVINAFGKELVQKRGVTMSSFLFDDGWDDHNSLWGFNSGFPDGFIPLKQAAAKYDAAPGVWLSPWGGYGKPRQQRLANAKAKGYEIDNGGMSLSGPKYYAAFHAVCMNFVEKFGVNQFKFDGTGDATGVTPGSPFGSDFEAAIQVIQDLRTAKPDIYINLTTGTWPSPFWLKYADSIWRGGDDHSFAGVGTSRQQWITYRDNDTYHGIVCKCPLYPLNSLMLHGMIFAQHAKGLKDDPGNDFPSEVHDYFGTGTQCQEMYITPMLLTQANWDTIAEAAKWSRENAATLRDVHWIGGDPGKGEVYGYAAWSPEKGILTLRNPSAKPATTTIDVQTAFELPDDAPQIYHAHSPWKADADQATVLLTAGKPRTVILAPFEVLTLEATPIQQD